MTLEADNKLDSIQMCLSCEKEIKLELGDCLIRYGSFIEFTCYECQNKKIIEAELRSLLNQKKEKAHTHLMEDFSELIYQHFPNFDNNINKETWDLLVLFTDEAISQLMGMDSK